MGRLEGKVAVITGAATGIGAASARRFAAEGASVVVADIRSMIAEDTAADIVARGDVASAVAVDVTDPVQVEAMVAATLERHGGLHILFSNAGVLIPGRVHDMPLEIWQKHLDVNMTGSFLCAKYAVPAIKGSGGGSILLTGSTASLVAEQNDVAYVASKGGVLMLARALALDYARDGIRVNCLCPGWIDTPFNDPLIESAEEHAQPVDTFIPAGRQGVPDEVAEAALFLVSDEASYISGHAMLVDGAFTAM